MNGVITVGQFETLMKRTNAVKMTPVHLPLGDDVRPTIVVDDEYALVEGTWIIEGDEAAFPLNVTTYQCYREFGHCFRTDLSIDGTDASSYGIYIVPSAVSITSWNNEEIVMEDNGLCRNNTVTINAQAKGGHEYFEEQWSKILPQHRWETLPQLEYSRL